MIRDVTPNEFFKRLADMVEEDGTLSAAVPKLLREVACPDGTGLDLRRLLGGLESGELAAIGELIGGFATGWHGGVYPGTPSDLADAFTMLHEGIEAELGRRKLH